MSDCAVLISINPKWCDKIASGEKTIEVRKTRPKIETPFKCYIYCTKPSYPHEDFICAYDKEEKIKGFYGGGKVIGEFVCASIKPFDVPFPAYWDEVDKETLDAACLTYGEAHNYLGHLGGYAWHISDMKIYDNPKELSEFYKWGYSEEIEACEHYTGAGVNCVWPQKEDFVVKRPPQSWMYVEEVDE